MGWGGGEERKESNRLNIMIFLVCAFLVMLSIYAGVLTKQTVQYCFQKQYCTAL